MKVKLYILTTLFFFILDYATAATKTSVQSGNWAAPATWSPAGVPGINDDVIITAGHTIELNSTDEACKKLIVSENGKLHITNTLTLTLHGDCVIKGICHTDNGMLKQETDGSVFNLTSTGTFIWNPSDNTLAGATLWTKSTEDIKAASTIEIEKWYDYNVPFGEVLTGAVGNLVIRVDGQWNQKNSFSTHAITGTLTLEKTRMLLNENASGNIAAVSMGGLILKSGASLDVVRGTYNGLLSVNIGEIEIIKGNLTLTSGGAGHINFVSNNITIRKEGVITIADEHEGNADIHITGNLNINGGIFYGKYNCEGNINVIVDGDLNNTTSVKSGEFYAITDGNGNAMLTVKGNITNDGYMDLIWNSGMTGVGNGNAMLNVEGSFIQTSGDFRGIFNITSPNAGNMSFSAGKIIYSGGIFISNYSCNTNGSTNIFNVNGNVAINFQNESDLFRIVGLTTLTGFSNKASLQVHIAGDLSITGNNTAEFRSSAGNAEEIVAVDGKTSFAGGTNFFNNSNAHNTRLIFNNDVIISGGNTSLCYSPGNASIHISGMLHAGNGKLSFKNNTGSLDCSITGDYYQSSGEINIYNNTTELSGSSLVVNLFGNFNQSGGMLRLDNNPSGNTPLFYVKGENITLSGGGRISCATSDLNKSGFLLLSRGSAMNYSHEGDHLSERLRYKVCNGTNLNLLTDLQLPSWNSASVNACIVDNNAAIDAADHTIYAAASSYSGIAILDGGTLRLSNPAGMYAAGGTVSAGGNIDYELSENSEVQYYGSRQLINLKQGDVKYQYGKLTINNVADIGADPGNGDIIVRKQLNLNNTILKLNNKCLRILNGESASIKTTNGYILSESPESRLIWSNAEQSEYILPFINEKNTPVPVKINLRTGQNIITACTWKTNSSNEPLPPGIKLPEQETGLAQHGMIDRWWNISTVNGTTDITLEFDAAENTIADKTDELTLQNYTEPLMNYPVMKSGNSVTLENFKGSGIIALTSSRFTQPVKLDYFTVQPEDKKAEILWSTSTENNNKSFTIERSQDLNNWATLTEVAGSGNSTVAVKYSHIDENPMPGKSFYRLKYTDLNGTFSYSVIRPFRIAEEVKNTLINEITGIRPNPFRSSFTMQYTMKESGDAELAIYAINGQIMYRKSISVVEGINYFDYEPEATLPEGYYILKLTKGTETLTRKIIKSNK